LRSKLLSYLARKIEMSSKLFNEYVERLRGKYTKSIILLHGSRATGRQLPYSDYDLIVVLEQVDNRFKLIEEMRRLKPMGISVDLTVISINELDDPIIRMMLRESKVLYNGLNLKLNVNGPYTLTA